jgi:hypothetical protein
MARPPDRAPVARAAIDRCKQQTYSAFDLAGFTKAENFTKAIKKGRPLPVCPMVREWG